MKPYTGMITKKGYILITKIDSLDDFWIFLKTDKSIYARNRMYPTAFLYSWSIKLIKEWMNKGWFYTAYKI